MECRARVRSSGGSRKCVSLEGLLQVLVLRYLRLSIIWHKDQLAEVFLTLGGIRAWLGMPHAYARRPCETRGPHGCRMAIRPVHGDMRARAARCARIPLLTRRNEGSDGGRPCQMPSLWRYACTGCAVRTHMPVGPAKRGIRSRLVRLNARPSAIWVRARGGEGGIPHAYARKPGIMRGLIEADRAKCPVYGYIRTH